jgi:exosortase
VSRSVGVLSRDTIGRWSDLAPVALAAAAFAVLFVQPFVHLVKDWWNVPEAGHGLLLAPVAVWLAWKSGRHPEARPQFLIGGSILFSAVIIRYASELAAELFTTRVSMLAAVIGLVVFHGGVRQALRWWLPLTLGFLAVPLPELITQALALPLQFKASQMGTALLETRQIPVQLSGNVIRLPGHELFVTEACSGLRSLTALTSTAILAGALFLKTVVGRAALLLIAIPVAIVVNGLRVFATGFLVYFVSPSLGTGFMHATEGWLLFLVSLVGLAGTAAMLGMTERWIARRQHA